MILYEAQIKVVYILYYKRRDLLFIAKTGFRKTLIFLLILFLLTIPHIVLILMLLKLFQTKYSKMINYLLEEKDIVLNRKNNINSIFSNTINKKY